MKKLILLISFTFFGYAQELYIFTINNNCNAIFPSEPSLVFGSYKYHDKTKNILFSAKKVSKEIHSKKLEQINDKNFMDNSIKKSFGFFGDKILAFESIVKNGIYIAEYIVNSSDGDRLGRIYHKGYESCEWYILSPEKINFKEVEDLFFKYKHNILLE